MKVGYHSAKSGGHCGFSLSRDFARPRSQRVMLFYRQEPIKVSYHLPSLVAIGTLVVEICF